MVRYKLPDLPYDYSDLEPIIARRIMELHHTKHHKAYVDGANAGLEALKSSEDKGPKEVRAIQRTFSFNLNGHILHTIFWNVMKPPEDNNRPGGEIEDALEKNFGSFEAFRDLFSKTAVSVEGVGWAVLYTDGENLTVGYVEKHNLNHITGFRPILVLDVWEHAYYLQYENRRKEYVENWWNVVNWDVVEKLYKKDFTVADLLREFGGID